MIYYVPAVLLKSTLAKFSSWLGLKLSKYVFMLKLPQMLWGCKSFCGGAVLWEGKGCLCTGKRGKPRWCKFNFQAHLLSEQHCSVELLKAGHPCWAVSNTAAELLPCALKSKLKQKDIEILFTLSSVHKSFHKELRVPREQTSAAVAAVGGHHWSWRS